MPHSRGLHAFAVILHKLSHLQETREIMAPSVSPTWEPAKHVGLRTDARHSIFHKNNLCRESLHVGAIVANEERRYVPFGHDPG